MMEAYLNGVSTRSVDDLVKATGVDTGISKSEVSRICTGLDVRVEAFRGRTLGHDTLGEDPLDQRSAISGCAWQPPSCS